MRRGVLVALVLLSCGGDDDGDTPAGAIETLLLSVKESMLRGEPMLDVALFADPSTPAEDLANPIASPGDSGRTLALGDAPADGTSGMEVTAASTFTTNAAGTGTMTSRVTETATGFVFLDYVATIQKPQLAHRIPGFGLAALAADGTGQAFAILSIESSGSVTRTFTNENPQNGHRLVDFGEAEAPSGTATGSGSGKIELLVELVLSRQGGKLVAKLGRGGAPIHNRIAFRRDGGPDLASPDLTFSSVAVGDVTAPGPEHVIRLGNDMPGGSAAAADGTVSLTYAVTGVGEGLFVGGEVFGPFDPPMSEIVGPTGSFSAPLSGLGDVNDGAVQVDASVFVNVFVVEPLPELEHSIGDEDLGAQDLVSAAYLGSAAVIGRSVLLMR